MLARYGIILSGIAHETVPESCVLDNTGSYYNIDKTEITSHNIAKNKSML